MCNHCNGDSYLDIEQSPTIISFIVLIWAVNGLLSKPPTVTYFFSEFLGKISHHVWCKHDVIKHAEINAKCEVSHMTAAISGAHSIFMQFSSESVHLVVFKHSNRASKQKPYRVPTRVNIKATCHNALGNATALQYGLPCECSSVR